MQDKTSAAPVVVVLPEEIDITNADATRWASSCARPSARA
jgi:hypothetical protein